MEWELLTTVVTLAATTSTGTKCLRPKRGWRGLITRLVMHISGCR